MMRRFLLCILLSLMSAVSMYMAFFTAVAGELVIAVAFLISYYVIMYIIFDFADDG